LSMLFSLSMVNLVLIQSLFLLGLIIIIVFGQLQAGSLQAPYSAIPLFVYLLFAFFFGYADTRAFQEAERLANLSFPDSPSLVSRSAMMVSAANQTGALVGALVSFFVNVYLISN